jgi:hypothetical protein
VNRLTECNVGIVSMLALPNWESDEIPIPAWGHHRRVGVIMQPLPTTRIDRHLLVSGSCA